MIDRFVSGVSVVTAIAAEERIGATATAVTSVSAEPPMLLVCLDRDSTIGAAIDESGLFTVDLLTEEQEALAGSFDGGRLVNGVGPALAVGSLAHLECRVTERVTSASHIIFIGLVEAADASEGKPLTHHRGRFGRLQLIDRGADNGDD